MLWLIHAPAWGLAIPALFWLVVAGSDALFGHPDLKPEPPLAHGRQAMPRLVAVGAIGVLGLAVLRAAVGGYVLLGDRSTEGPLVVWGAAMMLSAWGLYLILRIGKLNDPPAVRHAWFTDPFVWVMGFALLVGIYVWVRIGQNVWATGVQLGAVGVIEVFLILATIVVGGLVMLAEWVASPKTFQLLGFRRFPVFILLLGWAVIASTLPVSVGYHDVRFVTVPASDTQTMVLSKAETPQSVFRRWLQHLPAGSFDAAQDGSRRGVPLILISTAGGGVKAGYWTALVLDCLLQAHPIAPACAQGASGRDQTSRVLAASGASGGSMGLTSYVAHATQSPPDPTDGANWVAARLGGDYLSAELAWELAVELPRSLLRFSPGMDRAEVSERAWQASWVGGPWTPGWTHASWTNSASQDAGPMAQGFFALWERGGQAGGPAVPLLMLNGTGVTNGCRFNTSALDGNGGDHGLPPGQAPIAPCLANDPLPDEPPPQPVLAATQDLEDFLCQVGDERRIDVRLSTAVMLSARFPFVSPSGRIEYCGAPRQAAFVVGGGYQDNSGASSILELWRSLEPLVADYNAGRAIGLGDPASTCLVPFLIQIDSGYGEPTPDAPTKRPGELTVPVTGALSARSAFTALVEQAARITFNRPDTLIGIRQDNRYARLYPRAHPGTEAPTGWVLSNASQRDLLAQLAENVDQIKEVQSWFNSDLACGS